MPFVYILYSEKYNKTYTGITLDLEKRLQEHNSGKSTFTSRFLPWKIIHFEKFEILQDARKRERYYKSASGRKKIKSILHSPVAQR